MTPESPMAQLNLFHSAEYLTHVGKMDAGNLLDVDRNDEVAKMRLRKKIAEALVGDQNDKFVVNNETGELGFTAENIANIFAYKNENSISVYQVATMNWLRQQFNQFGIDLKSESFITDLKTIKSLSRKGVSNQEINSRVSAEWTSLLKYARQAIQILAVLIPHFEKVRKLYATARTGMHPTEADAKQRTSDFQQDYLGFVASLPLAAALLENVVVLGTLYAKELAEVDKEKAKENTLLVNQIGKDKLSLHQLIAKLSHAT